MKKNNEKKSVWKRWYMIVLYVFVGLMVLGSLGEDSSPQNAPQTYTESRYDIDASYREEADYINYMETFFEIYNDMADTSADTMGLTGDGSISINECSYLFGLSKDGYDVAIVALDSMAVPVKYKESHSHVRKSAVYLQDATRYLSYDCGNPDYQNKALIRIELATIELNKANDILEAIN